jgi:hypothetical protein
MKKRVLSLALAVLMCLSLVPAALAAGTPKVGETVSYGQYNYIVLAVEGNKALLITKDCVSDKFYNENEDMAITDATTWETATIRVWLNGEFYNTAFSAEEKKAIIETDVITPQNPEYSGATLSKATKDKVFLLSYQEAKQYFPTDDARKATFNGQKALWRTRTSGITNGSTCYVYPDGSLVTEGFPVGRGGDIDPFGIRPALWVQFENAPITSDWAAAEIAKAAELGLIPDTLKGGDLTRPITRAEFAAVSVKVYESLSGVKAIPAVNNPFTDTKDVEVLKAYNLGITTGTSADKFSPDVLLSREQAATMLTRVFKKVSLAGWTIATDGDFTLQYTKPPLFADDALISAYAKDSVYFMVANKIINGTGNNKFSPRAVTPAEQAANYASATREAALLIAVRMVENLK